MVDITIDDVRKGGRPRNEAGRKVTERGYVTIRTPEGKWVAEHRVVLERALGRPLLREEQVKWKDGNRSNNALDNLELWVPVRIWPPESVK